MELYKHIINTNPNKNYEWKRLISTFSDDPGQSVIENEPYMVD